MSTALGNIYQMARKASGLTQEVAAEYLKITSHTLSKYENGKVVPDNKMVARMAYIYNTPWLMVQHIELHDEEIQNVFPKVPITQFGLSVLNLETVLEKMDKCRKTLIRISRDNKIDDVEYKEWLETEDVLMECAGALLGVVHSIKDSA